MWCEEHKPSCRRPRSLSAARTKSICPQCEPYLEDLHARSKELIVCLLTELLHAEKLQQRQRGSSKHRTHRSSSMRRRSASADSPCKLMTSVSASTATLLSSIHASTDAPSSKGEERQLRMLVSEQRDTIQSLEMLVNSLTTNATTSDADEHVSRQPPSPCAEVLPSAEDLTEVYHKSKSASTVEEQPTEDYHLLHDTPGSYYFLQKIYEPRSSSSPGITLTERSPSTSLERPTAAASSERHSAYPGEVVVGVHQASSEDSLPTESRHTDATAPGSPCPLHHRGATTPLTDTHLSLASTHLAHTSTYSSPTKPTSQKPWERLSQWLEDIQTRGSTSDLQSCSTTHTCEATPCSVKPPLRLSCTTAPPLNDRSTSTDGPSSELTLLLSLLYSSPSPSSAPSIGGEGPPLLR